MKPSFLLFFLTLTLYSCQFVADLREPKALKPNPKVEKTYEGKIGEDNKIFIHLTYYKGSVKGSYFSMTQKQEIEVDGKLKKDGSLTFENTASTLQAVKFRGKLFRDEIEGDWFDQNDPKAQKCIVTETEENYQDLVQEYIPVAPNPIEEINTTASENINTSQVDHLPIQYYALQGSINNEAIAAQFVINGTEMMGSYFYHKNLQEIHLVGSITQDGAFTLHELDPKGMKIVQWKGLLMDNSIVGKRKQSGTPHTIELQGDSSFFGTFTTLAQGQAPSQRLLNRRITGGLSDIELNGTWVALEHYLLQKKTRNLTKCRTLTNTPQYFVFKNNKGGTAFIDEYEVYDVPLTTQGSLDYKIEIVNQRFTILNVGPKLLTVMFKNGTIASYYKIENYKYPEDWFIDNWFVGDYRLDLQNENDAFKLEKNKQVQNSHAYKKFTYYAPYRDEKDFLKLISKDGSTRQFHIEPISSNKYALEEIAPTGDFSPDGYDIIEPNGITGILEKMSEIKD